MSAIYKYNKFGELVDYNANLIEIEKKAKLYINQSNQYYNNLDSMKYLKEIKYEDLNIYKNCVVIYHSE